MEYAAFKLIFFDKVPTRKDFRCFLFVVISSAVLNIFAIVILFGLLKASAAQQ